MKRFHPDGKKSKRRGSADSRRKSARRSLEITALESRLLLTGDTTSTVLTSSSSTVGYGQSPTLTATVTDLTHTGTTISNGTVTFKDGTTSLMSVSVTGGVANYDPELPAVGTHDYTAVYNGTSSYLTSSSGLSASSTINTIAGNGNGGFSGIPGPATSAEFNPDATAVDAQGNLYIADQSNNYVYKVTPAGVISIFAGDGSGGDSGDGSAATSAAVGRPVGLSIDASGDVFIDSYGSQGVREVTPDGIIHNVAGNGRGGYSGDSGPATSAELGNPSDVAVAANGDIFIADSTNQVVREVADGIISTFAGNGDSGYTGDGGLATSAELHYPTGVAVDAEGDVFIADNNNNVIREVTTDGKIHTVAGNSDGVGGYSGDGGLATSAELSGPGTVAVNAAGDLFIADSGNNVIREVTPNGVIQTIAGTGNPGYVGDGGAASAAELAGPGGVSLDAAGDLFITDTGNVVIREVQAAVPVTVTAPATTTTTLTASTSSINFGSALTITVHVTDSNSDSISGGMVTFKDGTATLGMATLTNGTASLPVSSLAIGQHLLTASYAGTSGYLASYSALSASSKIETVAGTGMAGFGGDGGQGSSAVLNSPHGVAADAQGDLFIADSANNLVREVTPDGVIRTFAGTGNAGFAGDGGQANQAELNFPTGLAFDAAGNLYIADLANNVIRKVTPQGVISTVAGNGTGASTGDGGLATSAGLFKPQGLAFDSAGDLFIASYDAHRVREVTTDGIIHTFAGNGSTGYSGDGGPATSAQITPTNVAVDSNGNVLLADYVNNVVREVTPDGIIHNFAGNGTGGYSGDGGLATSAQFSGPVGVAVDSAGDVFIADNGNNVIREVTTDGIIHTVAGNGTAGHTGDGGVATSAELHGTYGLTFDPEGDLFISEQEGNVVREIQAAVPVTVTANMTTTTLTSSSSSIEVGTTVTLTVHVTDANSDSISGGLVTFKDGTTVLGTATLAAGTASLPVSSLAVGQHFLTASYAGTTGYLASATGLSATSTIKTIAGSGTAGFSGIGGPATSAAINVVDTVVDAEGDLYISDATNQYVYKVTPDGVIHIFAGDGVNGDNGDGGPATSAQVGRPVGLFVDASGDVFIDEYTGAAIREVTPDGIIHTVAGGSYGFRGDGGPATSAALANPTDVAVDANGDIFIADSTNQVVREVTPDGIIHTFAGTGDSGYSGDGGAATSAQLHYPVGVAVDANGDVFIDDHDNNVIREVTPDGIIHTVAGNGTSGYSGDGGLATSAELSGPGSVVVDAAGDLFIADSGNNVVREVTPDGIIHTVAGTGTSGYVGDGGAANAAELAGPSGVFFDAGGDLIITDAGNAVVRQVVGSLPVTVTVPPVTHFSVTSTPSNPTAGVIETITVTALDANNNIVTGYTGTVQLTSSDGQAILPANSTLANGVGTFQVTLETAATESITVTDTGNSELTGTESGIDVTPASAASFVVTGATTNTAGGIETVTVTAHDAYGNVATGYSGMVHITSSDGQAVLPPNAALSSGVGSFDVTLETVGLQSITATDTGNSAINGTESAIDITPSTATHYVVTSNPANPTAGAPITVTVTAYDAYGNVATGYNGTAHITSGDIQAVLPPDAALIEGVANFQVTLKTAATESITAVDTGNSDITGTESNLNVSPGLPIDLVVTSSTNDPIAGEPITVTATAYDAYGNIVTNLEDITVYLSSSDGQAILPPGGSPIINGVATFNVTFGTVGPQSITAVGSELSGTESNLDVSPGAATRFTVAATVNRPGYYTVTAFDGDGNLATTYAGTVQISSTDPAAALPPDAMLIDGVGTFRVILETPGRHLILATDSENPDVMGTESGIVTLSVSGTVYLDTNAGNSFLQGMPVLAGRVVFLDLNGDGTLDTHDPTATTNAQGQFTLYGGQAGEFPVLEATSQDTSMRYVVDQSSIVGMSVNIGVVPISPIAPVLVVPSPFSGSPSPDANTAYVESLYRAVLGRAGEGDGIAFWVAGLTSGMTRQGVAEDFINSVEHRQDEVNAYYEDFLHRAPDPAGSSFWVNALVSGVSEETVAELFLDSPEYQSAHQDSTSFLDNLYLDVLGRQSDGGGLASWQSALTSGTSRDAIVADFVQSTEAIDQVIDSDYVSFLHREPETGGPTIWLDVLDSPNGSASTVAVNILASPEFDEDAVAEIS